MARTAEKIASNKVIHSEQQGNKLPSIALDQSPPAAVAYSGCSVAGLCPNALGAQLRSTEVAESFKMQQILKFSTVFVHES